MYLPRTEHDVGFEVTAVIQVITDRGLYCYDYVRMEPKGLGNFIGETDSLVPGYKYVYSFSIHGDAEEVNDREYTLREGYHAKESHPLK